jgi:hypothetical protein
MCISISESSFFGIDWLNISFSYFHLDIGGFEMKCLILYFYLFYLFIYLRINCRFLIGSNGSIYVKSQISLQIVGKFSLDLRTYDFVETGENFGIVAPWWTKQYRHIIFFWKILKITKLAAKFVRIERLVWNFYRSYNASRQVF